MTRTTLPLLLIALTALSGCLASSYVIPQREIDRLLTLQPNQRARSVHVVQRFITADTPPPAPPLPLAKRPPPPQRAMGPPPAPVPPGDY